MASARFSAWLFVVLIALVSVHAHAESIKAECVQANTDAQSLRRDGKLAAAREQLRVCSQSKCPALVVTDCVKRLDELDDAQPSVVFDVVDASGQEVNDVAVSIDGRPLLDKLTGAAVNVDLGEHVLTFTAADRPAVQQHFVFREGEKARHLTVTLENLPVSERTATTPATAAAAPTQPSSPPTVVDSGSYGPRDTRSGSSVRTIGYVVGGVGVASLAVGGVFGYLANQAKKRQTDHCSSETACSDYPVAAAANHDAKTNGAISTVTVVVGAAAIATGLVLVFTAKHAPEESASTTVSVFPSVGPGGAGFAMVGAF